MSLTAHRSLNRSFLAGSTLLACAVFTLASAPARAVERALGGIPIYSPAQQVIHKYGNPTFVLTAGQTFTPVNPSTSFGGAPMNGAPMNGGAMNGLGPLPPMAPPQSLPELGGGRRGPMGGFGGGAASAFSSQQPGQAQTGVASPGEVTYVYQQHNGTTYQFLLAPNGKVIQITALGYLPQSARTSRGISLGSTYSQVLAKYGNPESIEPSGLVTLLTYTKRAHVAFQLVSNKVVGINVAAVSE